MATNKTQMKRVLKQLNKKGYVGRNWCLKHHISRLSAIIYVLRYEYSWEFKGERVYYDESDKTHWDYRYVVTKKGRDPYGEKNKN